MLYNQKKPQQCDEQRCVKHQEQIVLRIARRLFTGYGVVSERCTGMHFANGVSSIVLYANTSRSAYCFLVPPLPQVVSEGMRAFFTATLPPPWPVRTGAVPHRVVFARLK